MLKYQVIRVLFRFLDWLKVTQKHYDVSVKIVLGKHFESLGELLFSWENFKALASSLSHIILF